MKRYSYYILFLFLSFHLVSCAQGHQQKEQSKKTAQHKHTNTLIHESSPYLLQHAHNPVDWYPWGDEALEKAKKENKLLLISVGYAACHWCHVMEHESFEDSTVAQLMNDHFVCIKVDREERPDVDQIYMTACQLITKRGGWPLNAFALPDGKPFYAGTYFPKNDWVKILNYFIDLNKKDPASIQEAAQQITEGIAQTSQIPLNPTPAPYSMDKLNSIFQIWKKSIDFQKGGLDKAPKFPIPSSWDFILQYNYATKDAQALEAVNTTLEHMARGGIYDQLGGGFARYSTDKAWKVPHFEKMLYDNGQLVSLYAQAYQQTKNPLYQQVIEETLTWIEREMTSKEGGFYSSLDADSEGKEGKFYIWTAEELKTLLGEDSALFMDYYQCTKAGNWEHKSNILLRHKNSAELAKKYNISEAELSKKIDKAKGTLLRVREKRIRPGLDDKILTAWNALMLKGYVKAYRALNKPEYLKMALKNANFLLQKTISKEHQITRNYKDGKAVITGFLDDYAFVTSAFIELYQVTFDEKWLNHAKALTEHTLKHFFDKETGMFNYAPDYNSKLVARNIEVTDNVIPSSNSEMAHNLYRLGLYFYNKDYTDKALQMLANVEKNVADNPAYFSNWAKLMLAVIQPPYEVAIMGKDFEKKRQELDQYYLPNVLLMGGKSEGNLELLKDKLVPQQTTIYVCQNKACKRPVTESQAALKLLQE